LIHVELPAACANTNAKTSCISQPGERQGDPASETPDPPPRPVQRSDLVVPRSVL
jgi:hypothetical protein